MLIKKILGSLCVTAMIISAGTPVYAKKPASTVRRPSSSKSKKKAGRKKKYSKENKELEKYAPRFRIEDVSLKTHDKIMLSHPGKRDDLDYICVDSKYWNKLKFYNSNPKVTRIKVYRRHNCYPFFPGADCEFYPIKAGKTVITVKYPGGKKKFYITVKEEPYYTVAKEFIAKVKKSHLDDAHKAFVIARWMESKATYGRPKKYCEGPRAILVAGKGICDDYADTYEYLLKLANIPVRYVDSYDHGWNQVKIKGKWYNVDTCWNDCGDVDYYFMQSDKMFSDYTHKVSRRCETDGKSFIANGTAYDNYSWEKFAKSDQFKSLIS